MKILQYRGEHPNFGDELNGWLWPKLLPDFFDDDPSVLFIGIGSTIGDVPDGVGRKIVCGAGFVPHYHERPNLDDGQWDVLFVRGPRTAERLGLPREMGLGDSGILTRTRVDLSQKKPERISFMPHWQSMERGNWQKACDQAGIHLIDPRLPVEEVMDALMRSRLVIAEAMHGAIIADAFRIPWVPVMPLNIAHREKWYDWAESLGIELRPRRLWPSSLQELSVQSLRQPRAQAASFMPEVVAPVRQRRSALSRVKGAVLASGLAPRIDARLSDLAAHRLTKLAAMEPLQSEDRVMERVTAQMLEKVSELPKRYRRSA